MTKFSFTVFPLNFIPMRKFKMLVLTDHAGHSVENALYRLVRQMRKHPLCARIDVASKANCLNDQFFYGHQTNKVYVSNVDATFDFHADGRSLTKLLHRVEIMAYDVVWLRIPPPVPNDFLDFLLRAFPEQLFINDPFGIQQTGSKIFLQNFEEFCPPMEFCSSIDDIVAFKRNFPIVLKPLQDYGGKGIIKIDGEKVWWEKEEMTFAEFTRRMKNQPIGYLAVQYLKNVIQGDKRIIVIDGQILGASLRLPAKDSWLCNVAMGGSSNYTEITPEEIDMIDNIDPILSDMGIFMYGVDTLLGDNGKRFLSEINTTSIGGLPQIADLTGLPLLEKASDLIWNYVAEKSLNEMLLEVSYC